jgi:hypothetical protein
MHCPLVHWAVPVQVAQVTPPVPHAALLVPVRQRLLAFQQPLQVGVTHWLLVQRARPVQTAQVAPPVPQAPSAVPVWQVPVESTHPLQVGFTH